MRIYFDVCCVNRLTDDQTQERILREAECYARSEIARNPDVGRREDAQAVLAFAKEVVKPDRGIVIRGRELSEMGFSEFDALHLACAEAGRADVFLTTDDRLIRTANRWANRLAVRLLNPVSFLEEVKNANPRNE